MPPHRPSRARRPDAPTRAALLVAAAAVFAESGFRHATIRDICRRASANVAAIHYHFGDKAGLYAAVLQEGYRAARDQYPADLGLPPHPTPEQRLQGFIRSFLLRIFSPGRGAVHGKLMAREMIDPTDALDTLAREEIAPMAANLMTIVRHLLGPGARPAQVRLCAMSIVSQILFYHHCRPVITRVFPEVAFTPAHLEEIATHIARFSLAGLGRRPPRRRYHPRAMANRRA